ncbi:MAG: glycosyltransferase family 2 protein [Chryseobacterium sp.]|nr:MAG: glycosyltransferase family 2 protein [Chryseobacterium sp.]
MKVAIAILNWNGAEWLRKFLPSVVTHSSDADIYVIDNASSDNSIAFVTENFPEVKLVRNDKNYGFAGGYNVGLKQIDADIYCLLNSDVEVTPGWIQPVVNVFIKHPEAAAVQPKILSWADRTKFEFAGAAGGLIDNLAYPYCRGRIFDEVETDNGQYDDEVEIFWASGCCLFIRAKDFHDAGGFDERFFAHQEEIDLCWRLINLDRKIRYTHRSVVYHVGGGTLNKQSPQKTFLNFRNNLSMMLKNMELPRAYPTIFLRLTLDGIAGVRFLFTDGFAHTWAIVRAHFAFYGEARETLRRRGKHQLRHFYQTKWLVFRHFIGKK